MSCSCFATWADDLVTQPIFTAGMYLGQMIELRTLTDADVEAHNHGEDAEVVRSRDVKLFGVTHAANTAVSR